MRRPISELIVRIDDTVDSENGNAAFGVEALVARAREVVAPNESGTPFARRYDMALQEHPDAVFAHRDVTNVLKKN